MTFTYDHVNFHKNTILAHCCLHILQVEQGAAPETVLNWGRQMFEKCSKNVFIFVVPLLFVGEQDMRCHMYLFSKKKEMMMKERERERNICFVLFEIDSNLIKLIVISFIIIYFFMLFFSIVFAQF